MRTFLSICFDTILFFKMQLLSYKKGNKLQVTRWTCFKLHQVWTFKQQWNCSFHGQPTFREETDLGKAKINTQG